MFLCPHQGPGRQLALFQLAQQICQLEAALPHAHDCHLPDTTIMHAADVDTQSQGIRSREVPYNARSQNIN